MGATPAADRAQGAGARGPARHRARPDARRGQPASASRPWSARSAAAGLGDLGIRYGYQRFMPDVMAAVVVVLIVLVQAVQSLGDRLARRLNKRHPPRLTCIRSRSKTRRSSMLHRRYVRCRPRLALAAAPPSPRSRRHADRPIGVTPGPHAQILEAVKPIAAKKGLDIKIIEFSDYVVPNPALGGRRARGQLLPAPALSRQPERRPRLQDRERRPDGELPDRHLFEEAQELGRGAGRRAPSRSRTTRPMAAARCCCCRTRASSS